MKTPEEIKKGLECCTEVTNVRCGYCPYYFENPCLSPLAVDALAYIQQLEEDRKERDILADAYQELMHERDQYKCERDAAVKVMSRYRNCDVCKHQNEGGLMCITCKYPNLVDVYPTFRPNWEWRSVPQEGIK